MGYKPVKISNSAFTFCRYGVSILIWIAFILQIKYLVGIVFMIMLLSVIFKVQNSPLVFIYSLITEKILKLKTKKVLLDQKAMVFAHSLGTILSLVSLFTLYFISEKIGWIIVFLFGILKTISAVGLCPATKLYNCVNSSTCCTFLKRKK